MYQAPPSRETLPPDIGTPPPPVEVEEWDGDDDGPDWALFLLLALALVGAARLAEVLVELLTSGTPRGNLGDVGQVASPGRYRAGHSSPAYRAAKRESARPIYPARQDDPKMTDADPRVLVVEAENARRLEAARAEAEAETPDVIIDVKPQWTDDEESQINAWNKIVAAILSHHKNDRGEAPSARTIAEWIVQYT
jgi:hypothetical protein